MLAARSKNLKLERLTKKQVRKMALESLKEHLELKSLGKKSSADKVLDVRLAAAANNTSIDRECDELGGAPSPNTVL